jgi:predicted glycosyltransferase involved in capsule biosynthesis
MHWTYRYWSSFGVPIIYGIAETVNRSAARNDAARKANASILFHADADMWIPPEQFHAAVERAAETGCFVHAYTKHLRLNKAATQKVYEGTFSPSGQLALRQSAGAIAVPRELHDRVGGHDERFIAWGGEDRSFQYACQTLGGVAERIEGYSYHLWHPRDRELNRTTPQRKRNIELATRYKTAGGSIRREGILGRTVGKEPDPDAMLAILREPGGPLFARVGSAGP